MVTLASDTSFLRLYKDNTNLPFFQISGAFLYQIFVKKRLEIIDFYCIIFVLRINGNECIRPVFVLVFVFVKRILLTLI